MLLTTHSVSAQGGDGASLYAAECARCHGDNLEGGEGPQLVGPGHGLSAYKNAGALLQYVMESMPNDQPSTLSPADYSAIVALILSKHGLLVPDGGLTPGNAAGIILP
ncbi:MAG: c-type cytochrome [Chloroflexota bacterium]